MLFFTSMFSLGTANRVDSPAHLLATTRRCLLRGERPDILSVSVLLLLPPIRLIRQAGISDRIDVMTLDVSTIPAVSKSCKSTAAQLEVHLCTCSKIDNIHSYEITPRLYSAML
jgi:hypothetical protein